MKNAFALALCAGLCAVAAPAFAGPEDSGLVAMQAREISPVRVARTAKLPDGRIVLTSPWMNYADLVGNDAPDELVYDAAELDPTNPQTGPFVGGIACGLAGDDFRYSFGATTFMMLAQEDITLRAGTGGSTLSRIRTFFRQHGTGVGSTEQLYMFVNFADEVNSNYATCVAPASGTLSDGIVFDFGPTLEGFYSTNAADLSSFGVTFPADGNFAYVVTFGDEYDAVAGTYSPSTAANVGLWGPTALKTPAGPNQGTTLVSYWRDVNNNAVLDNGECRSANPGPCFSAWGFAVALFGDVVAPPSCRADLNGDTELTFDDIQLFIQLFNANDNRADLNSDQEWTFDDIQLFISLFNAGC